MPSELRRAHGLTIAEMAHALGCTADAVRRWELRDGPRARSMPTGAREYLRAWIEAGMPVAPVATCPVGPVALKESRKRLGFDPARLHVPGRTWRHWELGTRAMPTWARRFYNLLTNERI